MSLETARTPSEHAEPKPFAALIYRLVHTMDELLTPGEVAELRRLQPEQPGSPAFYKIAAIHLSGDDFWRIGGSDLDEIERRWAVILSSMAHTKGLHQPGSRLGKALAEAGFHELRFVRLLRASDARLLKAVSSAARFLAAKAEPFDFADLARLVESNDRPWAESFRRNVARGYYANLS
jgi:CRISPR system Cascade subunit CasB